MFLIEKQLGDWKNNGTCEASDQDMRCGPTGQQQQVRACHNGTLEKCFPADMERVISCNLPDCAKEFGNWTNIGGCMAEGNIKPCGPGIQEQSRNCTNGTTSICNDADTTRGISCREANTALPECSKRKHCIPT